MSSCMVYYSILFYFLTQVRRTPRNIFSRQVLFVVIVLVLADLKQPVTDSHLCQFRCKDPAKDKCGCPKCNDCFFNEKLIKNGEEFVGPDCTKFKVGFSTYFFILTIPP